MKRIISIMSLALGLFLHSAVAQTQTSPPDIVSRVVPITFYLLADETDSARPTVGFVTPLAEQRFAAGEAVAVMVQASDSDGTIAKVDLYVNDQIIRSDVNAPYIWDDSILSQLTPGSSHTLRAVATDNLGLESTVERTIQIEAANLEPVASFVLPDATATFVEGDSVAIEVGAQDSDGSIALVEF